MTPIIGIDFDNTIVCYHKIFHQVAQEWKLIPENFVRNKERIRDFLREQGQETQWTALQGYVYGKRMAEAQPFPGFLDFLRQAINADYPVYIISHKTQFPYLGPRYDLHLAASQWLAQQAIYELGLPKENVYFAATKAEKCKLIAKVKCTHFIDDLPEIFSDTHFPAGVHKLLFVPEAVAAAPMQTIDTYTNWVNLQQHFFDQGSI